MRIAAVTISILLLAPAAVAQTYDGSWSGTTAQNKSISFTLTNNAMPTLSFGGTASAVGCSTSFTLTTNFTPSRAVSTPTFVLNGGTSTPGGTTWSLSGTFSSPTTVTGNLSFNVFAIPGVPGGCNASGSTTWSASRTGGNPSGPLAGVFAVVGSIPGPNGTSFKTGVQLHNPGTGAIAGKLVYHVAGATGSDSDPSLNYSLAPKQTVVYDDLLPAMGLSGLGTLDLVTTSGAAPLTTFRIFNDALENGTSGMSIDPLTTNQALQAGQTGVLLAPHDLVRFRMNIGVRTLSSGASMLVTVRDKDGLLRHTINKSFNPTFFSQISARDFLGIDLTPDDSISFALNTGSAIIYGAITDNKTQDPTLNYAKSVF